VSNFSFCQDNNGGVLQIAGDISIFTDKPLTDWWSYHVRKCLL